MVPGPLKFRIEHAMVLPTPSLSTIRSAAVAVIGDYCPDGRRI